MKKLVTALIIVLPLVFLIAVFAVTNIAKISTDIPATGINITNKGDNGVFAFDIADYTSPMFESDLGVEVLPYVAKNRGYDLTVTDAETGEATDIVSLDENGAFKLKDVGVAKLTYTSKDGGYTDSVIFNVSCSGVISFAPTLSDGAGNAYTLTANQDGEYEATVPTGNLFFGGNYYPSTAIAHAHFEAQDESGVKINAVTGIATAYYSGKNTVTMSVTDAFGAVVTKTIRLNVQKSGDPVVNGQDASTSTIRLGAPLGVTSLSFPIESEYLSGATFTGANVKSATFDESGTIGNENAKMLNVELTNAFTSPASPRYTISLSNGKKIYVYIDFADYDFNVYSSSNHTGKGDIVILDGSATKIAVSSNPEDNLAYTFSLEGDSVASISGVQNDCCFITAKSVGETTLTVHWTKTSKAGESLSGSFARKIVVTQAYTSLLFNDEMTINKGGLGKTAIANGRYENGNIVNRPYVSQFAAYNGTKKLAPLFENLIFTSSNDAIATVQQTANGVEITVKATGLVTITAEWKYGNLFGVKAATFTFNAVDGVSVEDYQQLVDASKKGKKIVLAKDIYLGENLFNVNADGSRTPKYSDSVMLEKLQSFTGEMKTSADYTYYRNLNALYPDKVEKHPSVRYAFEFVDDVFGNGHTVSAEYITNMYDSTDNLYDFALFRGPLDFVSTSMDGIKVAAVKGQDNISFLVRKDGVKVDNITLKGCDDSTLYENGEFNLSILNNIGTTLEIMSDATLTNSRVSNGRTVVRAFGRDNVAYDSAVNVAKEKINVQIDGCVLSNAREFILKVGTNRYVSGTESNPSPYLKDKNGNDYTACNSSACDDYIDDQYFVNTYVLADVTLKDSTLKSSGLFTIGIESHFAGGMLMGSTDTFKALEGWNNLAATSYPAILRLVGRVELADWKQLSLVDSSTLIETQTNNHSNLAFLTLNIAEMLRAVKANGGDTYKNIIATKDGTEYVHGGIAFYGGGKNYSALDMSRYTFEKMSTYNVNINSLEKANDDILSSQGKYLPLAAGNGDFRFVMFDASSKYTI